MTNETKHRFTGSTLDASITEACTALGAHVGEIQYEVVEESPDGVTIEAHIDPVAVLGLFLSEVFRAGELDLQVQLSPEPEALVGELQGGDLRFLTGSLGKGLDALQYLSNRVLNRRLKNHVPVHLDGEGFKQRRAAKLQDQAEAAADKAVQRGRPVTIGPLTPAARREIHMALADDPQVEMSSDGDGFLKRVVIRPLRR